MSVRDRYARTRAQIEAGEHGRRHVQLELQEYCAMRCIPESVTSGVLARLAADDVDAWQAVLFPEPVT